MRAAFYTLGCKVNQYETAAMEEQFSSSGFSIVPVREQADVYVINSCTVTGEADRKTRQLLRRLRRQNPDALVVLCGCFPQAFPQQAAGMQEADLIVGSTERAQLQELVLKKLGEQAAAQTIQITAHQADERFEPMSVHRFSDRTRALVKIQDGCERCCAYCIIPAARGPIRSRSKEDLRQQLQQLISAGHREVVLVGINLSCYGLERGECLTDAVRVAWECGLERIRLGSLEPDMLPDREITALSKLPGVCPQFHLSLQSGCNETLRRMRRQYDTAEYTRIVRSLRRNFDNSAVTTDVMVGFPGETDEEFERSLQFVRETGFARVHVFAYSRRPGTPAAEMDGQIPEELKKRRAARMAEAAQESMQRFLQSQTGKTARVLTETQPEPGIWEGYTENYTPVRFGHKQDLRGSIVEVVLTGVEKSWCSAVLPADADREK